MFLAFSLTGDARPKRSSVHGTKNADAETPYPYEQLTYVTKMKMTPDRTAVVVIKGLTLAGIPEARSRYRLGNCSALEWVIDQYQVSIDARSGITSDPNRLDDPEYIVRLVKQVVTVSVKTVELVDELAQLVTQEDWMGEIAGDEGKEHLE